MSKLLFDDVCGVFYIGEVARGSFRPLTNVTIDMLKSAHEQFKLERGVQEEDIVVLMEMTLNNLSMADTPAHSDFLDRVDILSTLDKPVLISNFGEYHRLARYLVHHTKKTIGIVMGVPMLKELFNEEYYGDLEGGIVESFGRLFTARVKVYVYPCRDSGTGKITTAANMTVAPHLRHLHAYLLENHFLQSLEHIDEKNLGLSSEDLLGRIANGDSSWESLVPSSVARRIKERRLFGYKAS